MPTLEEVLRRTVVGVNEKYAGAYAAADQGLHDAVLEASKAVESISAGRARLQLERGYPDPDRTTYKLLFGDRADGTEIDKFIVPSEGYPIRAAGSQHWQHESDINWRILSSAEEVRDYFAEMANNPKSELVLRLSRLL